MSKIICRKTENFEFVEYPYRMNYIAVICKDNNIALKPIINENETDFMNLDYNFGMFEFENKNYKTNECETINEIPKWFRNWTKENISNDNLEIEYSNQSFDNNKNMNEKRNFYLQNIGIL